MDSPREYSLRHPRAGRDPVPFRSAPAAADGNPKIKSNGKIKNRAGRDESRPYASARRTRAAQLLPGPHCIAATADEKACRVPKGRNVLGWRLLGYFLFAGKEKVTHSPEGRVEAFALKIRRSKSEN
jgi:hypothetical protein